MGDRSNVNIITEARANGTNVGINVYVTPFSTTHNKAIAFTGDNEHTIVTIDAPRGRIVLRNDMDGTTREFPWENVDEASHALTNMEKGHGRLER